MFETLSKQELNAMTSDQYKQNFEGASGDDFRKRVSELENQSQPATRKAGNVRGPEPAATPASVSFDPSFDLDEDAPASAPAPAAAATEPVQAAAPATVDESLPEQTFEYQPTSKATGKAVGGRQRFKYRTQDELIQKLAAAHSAASVRIRELSRDRKLDSIVAAGAAPRTQPEKEVPTTVEGLAAELRAQRESNFVLSVRAAVSEFQASVDWSRYRSNENAQSVILAVERAGDDPTDPAAYQRAFANMQQFLEPVVTAAATVEPIPAPAPAPVAAVPAAPKVRPANTARIATGLSNADVTFDDDIFAAPAPLNNGPKFYTAAELDRMPAEQMRKLLRSPVMAKRIDAVYEEAAASRGRR
jgi:hypothetical protein